MPATTARLALPYPIPDDSVDVPRDMLALATKLDPSVVVFGQGPLAGRPAAGVPGRTWLDDTGVTWIDYGNGWFPAGYAPRGVTPPPNPVNGQRWTYAWPNVSAFSAPILWEFEWSSASGRWYFIGGPPWQSDAFPNRTGFGTASLTTMINLDNAAPPGCGCPVPFAGLYAVRYAYQVGLTNIAGSSLRIAVGADGNVGSNTAQLSAPAGQMLTGPVVGIAAYGCNPGAVLSLYGGTPSGQTVNAAVLKSRMEVTPIYLTP